MMRLRPLVVDENNIIIGGNMRFKALKHLGYKDIPDDWIISADDFSEDEKREFIIKDNVSFGDWNIDTLKADWSEDSLKKWNVDVGGFEADYEPNYNPTIDTDLVSQAQVEKAGEKLESNVNSDQNLETVMCPHCYKEFTIEKT